jgi:CelD/BcsL family acetyltransferase involved in cellulose biosynthesis
MITIEKVTTREAFAELETQWNQLLAISNSDTITLTHQWLLTWWDVFNEDRELCLLLARDNGALIGVAPLSKRTVRHYKILPLRRIEFLASGECEADEICSDYLDFIVHPERDKEILAAFLDFLLDKENDWNELVLTDIAGLSPNLPHLREVSESRDLSWQVTREQICIFVPLPEEHSSLLANLSSQKRKRINKDRRVAKEQGIVAERFANPSEEFDAAFNTLVRLHQERWTSEGFPGSFASVKFSRFHRELISKIVEMGWVQVWLLKNNDDTIYAIYDFVYGGKISHYQSGMGTSPKSLLSPGFLLRDLSIEYAITQGLKECDFLKGDEKSYKFSWHGGTRPIIQVRLAKASPKESIYKVLTTIVNKLRPFKRSITASVRKLREKR